MKDWKLTLCLAVLILFVSCHSSPAKKRELPPIPHQREITKEEVAQLKGTATYENYMKLAEWVEVVWESNKQ